MPTPFVHWAQTESHVTLRIDLQDAQQPVISFSDEGVVDLKAVGTGHQGSSEYTFSLTLFESILPSECKVKCTASGILVTVCKVDMQWWPRLTHDTQRRPWLRIDFDRWLDENEDEEVPDVAVNPYQEMKADEMVKNLMNNMDYGQSPWNFDRKKTYLVLYNVLVFLGYLGLLVEMLYKYHKLGQDYFPVVWREMSPRIMCCVLAQWLEVLHSLVGYTRTSPIASAMQVGGRSLIIFLVIGGEPRMQDKPFVFYLFVVYSFIELFRYPYYALAVVKKENVVVTWLRYTLWIPLYPMGFICEGTILLRAVPFFDETGKYSTRLPNSSNFAFDFAIFLRLFLLIGFPPTIMFLVHYMRKQRYNKLVAPYKTSKAAKLK